MQTLRRTPHVRVRFARLEPSPNAIYEELARLSSPRKHYQRYDQVWSGRVAADTSLGDAI